MTLLQQAMRQELGDSDNESKLTSLGKDERCISVSSYVFRGGEDGCDRSRADRELEGQTMNHLRKKVTDYRVGLKDQI